MGSGCTDPETFVQAISDARCVFDMGVSIDNPKWEVGGKAGSNWSCAITEVTPICTCFMTCYESGGLIDLIS